jgi:hypothetical protein
MQGQRRQPQGNGESGQDQHGPSRPLGQPAQERLDPTSGREQSGHRKFDEIARAEAHGIVEREERTEEILKHIGAIVTGQYTERRKPESAS